MITKRINRNKNVLHLLREREKKNHNFDNVLNAFDGS